MEKEIHCKLQKSRYTLQSRAATCKSFKRIHAIVSESRTELYFVQSLQAQKKLRYVAKRPCYMLQHKLQRKLHRVTLVEELCSAFYNNCRDFRNHCKLRPEIATCNMSLATCNGFHFPMLRDTLQGKLHRVQVILVITLTGVLGDIQCKVWRPFPQ